ncbi:MAG: cytidylate kinase-like family protein [Bacteroidaceae bacterium]|nr:cytidylate kinase-like family protein [Bacteroidaceae bacterium]
MNKNEQFVITINRELGSGGRTVGRKLAEKLGVPFYDKAVINALEKKFNLSVEEIEKIKGRSYTWWGEFKRFWRDTDYSNLNFAGEVEDKSSYKPTSFDMFKAEEEILGGIASTESCVVAGRCGFHAVRYHPNHLNIFLQASMDFRVERVARKQQMTSDEARQTIEKIDKMRENYVKEYTGKSRYDTHNYQLVITADGKTEDEIVELILKFIG